MSPVMPNFHSVAFVGVDGSGKTTQARLLRQSLGGFAHTILIHPFGWRFLPVKPGRHQTHSHHWQMPGQHSSLLGSLAAVLEIIDNGVYTWLAYIHGWWIAQFIHQEVWLISDRSFDDLLIKHQQRRSIPDPLLRILRRLIPQPQTTLWLQLEPSLAEARDRDYPIRYYAELNPLYQQAVGWFGWRTIPCGNRSREAIFADVSQELGLPVNLLKTEPPADANPELERTPRVNL